MIVDRGRHHKLLHQLTQIAANISKISRIQQVFFGFFLLRLAMAGGTHPLLHDVNIYVAQDCTGLSVNLRPHLHNFDNYLGTALLIYFGK